VAAAGLAKAGEGAADLLAWTDAFVSAPFGAAAGFASGAAGWAASAKVATEIKIAASKIASLRTRPPKPNEFLLNMESTTSVAKRL